MILKCVARCRCSGKSRKKKSSVFTFVCLHTSRLNASASVLGHQINTLSKRLE